MRRAPHVLPSAFPQAAPEIPPVSRLEIHVLGPNGIPDRLGDQTEGAAGAEVRPVAQQANRKSARFTWYFFL